MNAPHPTELPDLRLEMLSQPRLLSAARTMISSFAARLGFSEHVCAQIGLAVDEALCNVINHGYEQRKDERIWIHVWGTTDDEPGLTVIIEDQGRQVDPSTIKSRDLDDIRPGGLGVHIIREVMDEVVYEERIEGGMRLTLTKRRADDEDVVDQPTND